jgi:hypothetical protein
MTCSRSSGSDTVSPPSLVVWQWMPFARSIRLLAKSVLVQAMHLSSGGQRGRPRMRRHRRGAPPSQTTLAGDGNVSWSQKRLGWYRGSQEAS